MGVTKIVALFFMVLFNSFSNNVSFPLELLEKSCESTGILCKSSTSYTFCTIIGTDALYVVNEFFCPEGYFCNDKTNFPCISADETTQEATTITVTTQEITESSTETITEIVTAPSTTKKPFSPPICIAKGLHPGPSCSQYYECVSEYFWSYKAVLRNCDEGLYFNWDTKSCVEQSLSGCVP